MMQIENRVKKIATPAIPLVIALVLPIIVTGRYYTTILVMTLIYIVVVFGLNFITGMTGQMHLGTAGVFCLGAYTSALITTRLPVNPWIALIASIIVGYLIGKGLGYPSLRVKGIYLSLTTIAFNEIVRQLINNVKFTGGVQGVRMIPTFSIFGHELSSTVSYYYFLVAIVVVFALISWKIINSKWGRAFVAVRDNPDAMEACGIDVADIKVKAFTLASIYGSVGGSLYAHFVGYINPVTFTVDLSVTFVIMLIVGGTGKLWGGIIGACVVTMLPEALRFLGEYYQLGYSIIVLLCVVLMPGGLISIYRKKTAIKGGA